MSCSIVPARHPNVIVMQETALPVWGSKADKIISQRKDLQDVLGNHQDSIVSAAFLRELGGRLGSRSGQNGFSYGVLYAREIYAGDSLLDELKPSFRAWAGTSSGPYASQRVVPAMGNGQCETEIATRQRGESAFDGQNTSTSRGRLH